MEVLSVRQMLAGATLAILATLAGASAAVAQDSQRLAGPTQDSNSEVAIENPFRARRVAATEESLPVGAVISDQSDQAPFVSDGWRADPACGSDGCACCDSCDECDCCSTCGDDCKSPKITADVELMALRTHFGEAALGKLAERYELSERLMLGVENENGIGGRVRYWSYIRTTPNLQGGSSIRADFQVTDFEGTTHFGNDKFDLLISGGVRWADIKIDIDSGRSRNDMPGGTVGLDLRGLICCDCENGLVWRSVTGARWSIFGGDWELSRGLIGTERDDNITVTELYGGVECSHCCRGRELYARLVFEAQNWRSDALGAATGVDSISFIGPGVNMGLNF